MRYCSRAGTTGALERKNKPEHTYDLDDLGVGNLLLMLFPCSVFEVVWHCFPRITRESSERCSRAVCGKCSNV